LEVDMDMDIDMDADETPLEVEQLIELAELARADVDLWEELKANELELDRRCAEAAERGEEPGQPPDYPLAFKLLELVNRRYPDEDYDLNEFVLLVRRLARDEAGLPTDVFLWLSAAK
jgi:hypothetical protein